MIAHDVRRLLIEAGVDQAQVVWHDDADAPTGPSHRWIVWSVGDEVVLGGADRGRFAAYARFGDPTLVAELLLRWIEPQLPPAPRDVALEVWCSSTVTRVTGATTSWAMRIPRVTANSSSPRLTSSTFTSPR